MARETLDELMKSLSGSQLKRSLRVPVSLRLSLSGGALSVPFCLSGAMNKVDSEHEKEEDTFYLCVFRGETEERQRRVTSDRGQ
jgi:hypothetical protein